ncbi:MAG TPA: hypothetical protein VFO55_06200 [Gemmatimonadaceae bacterium]|nr:hypothetical protein [Gemmatimonadaceae bacterium]
MRSPILPIAGDPENDPPSTSLMSEVLFPLPAHRRTAMGILTWWESRRLVYNTIVGTTGLVSLALMGMISLVPPGVPNVMPPWQAILAYGGLANICYTLGPAIEIALQRLWKDRVLPVGPVLFRQGLSFSIGLTLLPVAVVSVGWLVRAGMWLLSL